MHATFRFEISKGVLSAHRKADGLDPGLFALLEIQLFDRKAAPFRPAVIHSPQHIGPVLRIDTARTRIDRYQRIGVILLAGQHPT